MKNIQAISVMFIWTALSILVLYILDAHNNYTQITWAIGISVSLLFIHMVNMVIYFKITGKEPYRWFKTS